MMVWIHFGEFRSLRQEAKGVSRHRNFRFALAPQGEAAGGFAVAQQFRVGQLKVMVRPGIEWRGRKLLGLLKL
jgi:hypothetical protein